MIVDLNSVVKELVENSLDAGATSIEVRFKNQGLDSIEVSDNGKGISPDDYETIALKHYTSKLSSYEDLTSLETFGFRGEALSSLCALSKFHIITARAEDGAVGKRLEFETSGKLKGTSVVAAQRGTTVVVENLFQALPVRRKELEKNIKREYGKVTTLLNSYACISVGVRYAVSNQMPKGKKVVVFSTKTNTTTKENVVNVFGAKTLLALVSLDLKLDMEPSKGPSTQSVKNWSTQPADRSNQVLIQGHISKPVFGEGRQAPDRQMFFVNSRPCGLPQVSKAFNEVYKSFNVSQSPFIFANLIMDTNAYDVNVSPDKRTIMLHDQAALLDSLKSALTEMFEHTDHTVPQSTLPNRKLPSLQPLTLSKKPSTGPFLEENEEDSEAEEGRVERQDEDTSLSRPNAVTGARRSSSHGSDASPAGLIESWAGRDSELRKEKTTPQRRPSKGKQGLADFTHKDGDTSSSTGRNNVRQEAEKDSDNDDDASLEVENNPPTDTRTNVQTQAINTADPMSTPFDDLFSQRPPTVPKRVQDFNAFMDQAREVEQMSNNARGRDENHELSAEASSSHLQEAQIPALAPSSQKSTPGPVANAFDRMRPKRTPLQTAEITVGNQTTTTVIGSAPMYKKRKIHEPKNSQAIAGFGYSPLLARGLRNFAAPGSQIGDDDSGTQADSSQPSRLGGDVSEKEGSEPEEEEEQEEQPSDNDEDLDMADEDKATQDPAPRRHMNRHTSDLNAPILVPQDEDESDEDYLDEDEKKVREDARVAKLIQEAENAAAVPTSQNLQRASQVLKHSHGRKDSTLQLCCTLQPSIDEIKLQTLAAAKTTTPSKAPEPCRSKALIKDDLDSAQAENKLSLTVTKADFARMRIIGQFNLGFILAVRPASHSQDQDELFIIDQHAADEKYSYERFRRTTTLQSQRLVHPKLLDLTAVEQEVVLNHSEALKANGFEVEISTTTSTSPSSPSLDPENSTLETETRTCRLLTLPTSHTTTFDLSDLSELLYLLSDTPTNTTSTNPSTSSKPTTAAETRNIPRPRKVQRILAMRACRSSIMVGKTLTLKQMERVVRHMGEMEKPWNCPHGRPTMRHLVGLGEWEGWREGLLVGDGDLDGIGIDGEGGGGGTDWKGWLAGR